MIAIKILKFNWCYNLSRYYATDAALVGGGDYNDIPESGEYYFQRVEREENIVRMQLDWKF